MRCIDVIEGEEFQLPRKEADSLRIAVERLRSQLRPTLNFLSERAGSFRLFNIVGTIDIGGGAVVQVSPKVPVGKDWTTAVVSLLTGHERIEVAGERRAGLSVLHNRLLDAIADAYLARLEKAFRQDGPILLMERFNCDLPYLNGKLHVSKWAQSAVWRPHVFPVSRTQLAPDNPFTRALIEVAERLGRVSSNPLTRAGLRTAARDLSAGLPRSAEQISSAVASRALPEQWSAYKPAWSLATAILTRTSLLGPTGRHAGVGLAIEAWPLLETLLERTLQTIEGICRAGGRNFAYEMHGDVPLLHPLGPSPQKPFFSVPDGRLFEDGKLVANFEAKYKIFTGDAPGREDIYQALSTAAACSSPLAVLVYPNSFRPCAWKVESFGGKPAHLIAVGLDLFNWVPAHLADERGKALLKLIDSVRQDSMTPILKTVA